MEQSLAYRSLFEVALGIQPMALRGVAPADVHSPLTPLHTGDDATASQWRVKT